MSVYLHFDLGADREASHALLNLLVSLGAKPTPGFSIPIRLKSELNTYLDQSLRLLEKMDVNPCCVELRHVVPLEAAAQASLIWKDLRPEYIATYPQVTQAHHIVTVPKRGNQPPIAPPDAWSLETTTHAWSYHWRKTAAKRDLETIAVLFKGVDGVKVSSTLEHVVARWSSPFQQATNLHRYSLRRLIGLSERWLLNLFETCAEIKRNHDQPFLTPERTSARIAATLNPFRRMALAEEVGPLVMSIGLTPVLAKYFCTRGIAFASTASEAQTLIDGLDEVLFKFVHAGRSPILSLENSDAGEIWAEVLTPLAKRLPNGASQKKLAGGERNVVATSEHVLTLVGTSPFRPLNEIAREVLAEKFGDGFDVRDLGFLCVSFRTPEVPDGSRILGCFMALVRAKNLDVKKLLDIAKNVMIFSQRGPFRWDKLADHTVADPPAAVSTEPDDQTLLKQRHGGIRKLRKALDALRRARPGTRLQQLSVRFPAEYAWYMEDDRLRKFDDRVESLTNFGAIMLEMWTEVTGYSGSHFWNFQKDDNPPRGVKKKRKTTEKVRKKKAGA